MRLRGEARNPIENLAEKNIQKQQKEEERQI
jgi:hypothetical protein